MKFMDKLPAVISCCFCCFLRAGTVVISFVSFFTGLIFAPNVNHMKGFWDMNVILSNYSASTESAVQLILGVISIILCIVSVLLLLGALCNIPKMIEIYQWGALVYSGVTSFLFIVLAIFCFFVHNNILAGCALVGLIVFDILLSIYFIIVVNSLRISLVFLSSPDMI